MKRALAVLGLLPMAVWLAFDPYSAAVGGADAWNPAPAWQVGIAVIDALLLICVAAAVLRGRPVAAALLLTAEALWSLAGSALLVRQHGIQRFTVGFGGHETLSIYLATMALRVLLVAWLARGRPDRAATAHRATS